MFVLSQVVVGLAKKSTYKRQADSCKTEAFLYLEIHTGLSGTNRQSGRRECLRGFLVLQMASSLASQLPQFQWCTKNMCTTQNPVGAGLPAMADWKAL
ncbi:hypothetical protein QZR14_05790 [Pseudomonas sp. rhizo66]|uniref:hypothetical protein n=1 Tax=Pseudomonas sp. rhizo66 TaxID=3059674 RepID=UPI00288FBB4F|nr:hypothetical protein [Pseudomonas sp. rhizo66]MDT3310864.1 hypothetical protein [Pseudomonas sp. rhizo66]